MTDVLSPTLVSSRLPGVLAVRIPAGWDEEARKDVFVDGSSIGNIIYLRRVHPDGGTEYGWRPARYTRGPLLTQVDAIRVLL